jgi:hypothetical protein
VFGKQKTSFFLASVLLPVFLFSWLLFSPGASARLGLIRLETHIEIDGVSYGEIRGINNLSDLTLESQKKGEAFTRVILNRDFVTELSMYQWANNITQDRTKLTRISVIIQTKEGVKIARYELKNSKPLSWTVETDPLQGGFHEKIILAVQEIAVY